MDNSHAIVEIWISRFLQMGVLLSSIVIGLGWLVHLMAWGSDRLISIGLIMLILIPVLRVIMAGVIFLIQRDYLFFCFSSVVLFFLGFGFYWGAVL